MQDDIQQTTDPSVFDDLKEIQALEDKLNSSHLPDELRSKSQSMIQRLKKVVKFGGYSQEFEPVAKYIDWITQIPFGRYTIDNLDINSVKAHLDATHYGLEDTKSRILEYLAVLKLNTENNKVQAGDPNVMASSMSKLQGSSANAPILCLVGIQGVGKTSIAKSIAGALGRKFYRIALGGMTNVNALRGIARGNQDSEPGQIVKSLIRTSVMTPLVLLDEVDKVSNQSGARADVMAALLEILDPEQNSTFSDNYVDYPLNLSRTMFICTANNLGGISAALLDRLEIIRVQSYTDEDKIQIARNYMFPKVLQATGLTTEQLKMSDDVWPLIVRPLGFDAGIRELERTITRLARKVAMMMVTGQVSSVDINTQNFRQFIPEDFGVLS